MPIDIHNKKLLIVEGASDKKFFINLMKNRNIQGFDVFCPWDMGKKHEGEDSIIHLLNALPMNRNFFKVEKIIIVIDADNNSDEKFNKFKSIVTKTKEFSGTNEKYPVPNAPNLLAPSPKGLSVAILTLPYSESEGAMETLCFRAAITKFPEVKNCINIFANCAGVEEWSPQKRDKFKLRSFISMKCQKNPDLPTTYLWDDNPDIVPLDADVFNSLADYLRVV